MNAAVTTSAIAIPRWMVRRGHRATTPAPNHAPIPAASDHADHGRKVDQAAQQDDVDHRLGNRRNRVSDIERPGNVGVVDQVAEAKHRRGGGEGSDAEGIEEVRAEAEQQQAG